MDAQSPLEWLSLVRRHEAAARRLVEDRDTTAVAYSNVGFAAEP